MRFLLIFVAVLFCCATAQVQQNVEVSKVTVQTPMHVPHQLPEVEEVAHVVEVQNPDIPKDEVEKPWVGVPVVPDLNVVTGTPISGTEVPKVQAPIVPKVPEMDKVPETAVPKEVEKDMAKVPEMRIKPMLVDPTPEELECQKECTKFELSPICATNGVCLHEFANQCVMDVFRCLHPKLGFQAVMDDRCQMHWLKRCTEKDLME